MADTCQKIKSRVFGAKPAFQECISCPSRLIWIAVSSEQICSHRVPSSDRFDVVHPQAVHGAPHIPSYTPSVQCRSCEAGPCVAGAQVGTMSAGDHPPATACVKAVSQLVRPCQCLGVFGLHMATNTLLRPLASPLNKAPFN